MPENLRPSEPLLPVSRRTALQIGTLTACGLGVLEPPADCAAERIPGLQRRIDELEQRYEGEFSIEVKWLKWENRCKSQIECRKRFGVRLSFLPQRPQHPNIRHGRTLRRWSDLPGVDEAQDGLPIRPA